jgi:hypothetical protein
MSSGLIQPLLQRLVGVYADPLRISRDAAQLLNRVEGNALTPIVSQSMEHPRVLSFVGTISMPYRGVKYNIPVEIFLPPSYPTYPPICYVRPSVGMMLKENHKHVGPDGKIYMPYLHNWRSYSCNLVDLVLTMVWNIAQLQTKLKCRSMGITTAHIRDFLPFSSYNFNGYLS